MSIHIKKSIKMILYPKKIMSAVAVFFILGSVGLAAVNAEQTEWQVYRNEKFNLEFKEPAGLFGDKNMNASPDWFSASSKIADFLIAPESETTDRTGFQIHTTSAVLYAGSLIQDAVKYDREKNDRFLRASIENIPVKAGEGLKLTMTYDLGSEPCVSKPDEVPCPSAVQTYYIFYKAPYLYQFSLHEGADTKLADKIASTFRFVDAASA